MKLRFLSLLLVTGLVAGIAGQQTEFTLGRKCYADGDYKNAVAHFHRALEANPNDSESYYWIGMSYQVLADISVPFGGKYNRMARVCLTRAMEIDPHRPGYRAELFNFLLDSDSSSGDALRQAADILRTVPESDPDFSSMRQRIDACSRANSGARARFQRLFLGAERAVYEAAAIPASALSGGRQSLPGSSISR